MATAKSETIQYGTDYRLKTATLVTGAGKIADIRPIINEINVYEDVMNPVISGNIILNDSNNLINTLPITGFEYLTLDFEKPSSSQLYSKVFRVYKLSDRQRINSQNESYVLHFCSEESILNESLRVSKSYVEKTIDTMVRDIALNVLKIDEKKFLSTNNTPTHDLYSVIIPNWRPFFAINWLSRMARSASFKSPSYVFFEDRDGFHFTPLEALSQQSPIKTIQVSPRNLGIEQDSKSDLETTMKTAYEWEMPYGFDIVQNTGSGMYAGSLITVDPIRQRILNTIMSSEKIFQNNKHLNENPLITNLQSRIKTIPSQDATSLIRMYPTSLDHDQLSYGGSAGKMLPNQVEQWLIQRNMYFSALHSSKINISMPGDISLRVGQVIAAQFPAYVLHEKSEKIMDKLYSGNYFIMAIRHAMNKRTHMCYLELAKESSAVSYPSALNQNAGMKKVKSL